MALLSDLVPSPTQKGAWVPRPASALLTAFAGFAGPAQVTALFQSGDIAYGMISETSGPFAGKDVPFAYNVVTSTFETINIPGGAAALPTSPAAVGDWTPPTIDIVASYVIFTHPGYPGGIGPFFGWLDISGFSDNTHTGNTHSSTLIDSLSANVLLAGWLPGMTITGAGISANTTIKSIASGGLSLTLSQTATASANGVTLTVAGGGKSAPLYGAGNTNLNPLLAVPTAVANFNGRAYFAVPGNGIQLSDSLVPLSITNASQGINPGNGLDFTALGGLPMSQTLGGILQALICFQGDTGAYQITGDPAAVGGSTLLMNQMGVGAGTLAPNTLCTTPLGLAFIAPDGLRFIEFSGQISNPVGDNGDGVNLPFLNAIFPSRMAAAFNQNTLRISVQNGAAIGQPTQEYWYDFSLKSWSGPHSFPAALIVPFQGSPNHGFTIVGTGINAKLWTSQSTPTSSDNYVENGVALSWVFRTVLLPDEDDMAEHKMVQAMFTAAIAHQQTITIQCLDEGGNILDTVSIMGPSAADTIWGAFIWGQANWGGPHTFLFQHPIFWHLPIIAKQMAILINGNSAQGTILSNIDMQIETLGYLSQATLGALGPGPPPPPTGNFLIDNLGNIITDNLGNGILVQ